MIERLKFNIDLGATCWEKTPEYQILINDALIASGQVQTTVTQAFELDLKEGEYILRIKLTNKDDKDTLQDESGKIIKDMLLNINNIWIDDIEMGPLLWSNSRFVLDSPVEYPPGNIISEYTRCVNMGHNGTWEFKFKSPMYDWLIEIL